VNKGLYGREVKIIQKVNKLLNGREVKNEFKKSINDYMGEK
jgi:hypothetical protein